MLAQATPEQQKQMLGERLYTLIIPTQPQLAGKITGMFLDHLETTELLGLIDSPFALDEKIKLALAVLPATAAQEETAAAQKKVLCSAWPSPTPAIFTSVAHFHHRFHRYFSPPAHLGGGKYVSSPTLGEWALDTYHPHHSALGMIRISPSRPHVV